MSVIASCGHKLKEWEDLGILIETVGSDRYGNNTIVTGTYCVDCALKMIGDKDWQVIHPEMVTDQIRVLLKDRDGELEMDPGTHWY